MPDSILTDTKKVLGLSEEYKAFDPDVILHINSVFSTLQQLGVGPPEGFAITGDSETWAQFLGTNKTINAVKTYVYLRVRVLFDPPATSFHLTALKEQIKELEWRLNVHVDPAPTE